MIPAARLLALVALALASCATPATPVPAASEAAQLKEGDRAPPFAAEGDDGEEYALEKLRGKYVVLYFYPKDDTPGCTVEAQNFRDDQANYAARNAVVLGVSLDSAESHRAFREKHGLNFPLLVGGEALARAYGVPLTLGFAARHTFVIDPEGRLLRIFRKVDPRHHSAEVLAVLPPPAAD